MDEIIMETGETKEGLSILDLPRFVPILNCLDFIICHGCYENIKNVQEA